MSIAMSVKVKPSRVLLMMVVGLCIAVIISGSLIAFEGGENLSFVSRFAIVVSAFFLAFVGFYHAVQPQKVLHIDISSSGQLRVREDNFVKIVCEEKDGLFLEKESGIVQFLNDSTIWSSLILLRLKSEQGNVLVIPIFPDCISKNEFRALLAACCFIAMNNASPNR